MAGKVMRSIKNVANGYSSVQIMVRDATCNDPTGPSTAQMADVANHTYDNGEFLEVMDIIDRRLNDKGKNWRHVAKSLTLLDYLVRYGSDEVVLWAKANLYIIKTLREFQAEDATGRDQGTIIRVKAKELTSLLKDDERLRQERDVARQRMADRRRNRREGRPQVEEPEYDTDLQKALDESRQTAEEEERRRMQKSDDDSLERAIQLSLEEEELRKKNQNLLDLDDDTPVQPPQVLGFYGQQQQQDQGQIIGYDMFGNPVYANQAMATGYLSNAYNDLAQQQAAQQQAQAQQLAAQQAQQQQQLAAQQQQAALQQQYYLQQQQLYQQQVAAAQQQALLQQQQQLQQQQVPLKTGSNNPFAMNAQATQQPAQIAQPQQPPQQQQQVPPPTQQEPLKQTPTGIQKMNERYSELNQLLATGTGIDTFGNTGETRLPAQHTKTGTFINSQGTGYRQESNSNQANPFLGTQYTGIPSTGIVPAYTGYGFGNQPPAAGASAPNGQGQKVGASLIDL
ncbi:unnamed protein product [Ambrosiozyma monospora]|uniref:Unnamed protein product n=1 Tax=Ambrosiozyma monospora TaxID=43982 RepID=A0ACB5SY98_AMBMO|nr:unnamed protein product [Ambrosiozyma monospora]